MGFFDIIENDIRDYKLESEIKIKMDFQLITWLERNTEKFIFFIDFYFGI